VISSSKSKSAIVNLDLLQQSRDQSEHQTITGSGLLPPIGKKGADSLRLHKSFRDFNGLNESRFAGVSTGF
jgi:hypothetical protein